MGQVYRATDTKLGRDVALKVLPAQMAADPERLARFQREARAVAALNHPHIVTIFSVEEAEGIHFLTMELVEGQALDRLIPDNGMPIERITEIAGALADALAAAHEKGIMHRDLKPANVMVTNDGRVKVLDFGLAKETKTNPSEATMSLAGRTQAGVVMGTPAYMSPEQVVGRELDHRTDIFSLGVILHEMATGQRPFAGHSSAELTSAILRDTPPLVTDVRADLPSDLARIIRRCLEKDARHRIQTARDVANEFRDLVRQPARKSSPTTPSGVRAAAAADSGTARADEGFWVAVLPFKYAGGNADLTALADGLTDDILTGMSRFSYLRVIARSSTARYAQQAVDVRAAAKELGARYVMEGSIRQAGAKIRIAVQLVDANSGAGLWAETYDRAFNPEAMLDLLDDVVPRIVVTVGDTQGILARSMTEALRNRDPESLTPYEALLRSFGFHQHVSAAEHLVGRTALERAVQQAPDRADCWAMLSWLYRSEYSHGFNERPDSLDRALAAARRAVELAPSNQFSHAALASALFFRREFTASRAAAQRAVALNKEGYATAFLGLMLAFSGDWERGCALAERSTQLNPNHPGWYWLPLAFNEYRQGHGARALELALRINMPGFWFGYLALALTHSQAGEMEKSRSAVRELLAVRPSFRVSARQELEKWWQPDLVEQILADLQKAGLEASGAASVASAGAAPVRTASGETRTDEGFWIAVLPFKYSGSNADLKALAEGLSEEIVTGLSRFSYLRVIARGSTAKYSSESGDVRTIGKELGARYVMEGSLRQAGNKLRLAVQLVDTNTGAHLWAENFERSFTPDTVFELQDDLVPRIVSTVADMNGVLPRSMSETLRSRSPEQLSPYEAVLRSFAYPYSATPEELTAARTGLEEAVRKAPAYADAWAMLSFLCGQDYVHGYGLQGNALELAASAARRAVELGPSNHLAYFSLASVLWYQKDYDSFRDAAERAVALNPMDGNSVAYLGELLGYAGSAERGMELAERAKQLNPNHPGWYWFSDFYHAFSCGDYRGALAFALKAKLRGNPLAPMFLAAACGQIGDVEGGAKATADLLKFRPELPALIRKQVAKVWDPEYGERFLDGLLKAGWKIPPAGATEAAGNAVAGAPATHVTSKGRTERVDTGSGRAQAQAFWIAVLPFTHAGSDAEVASFADGLAEDITAGLARFPYLFVISRNSTMRFAGQASDVRAVGGQLGARYVLGGGIRKSGTHLRINAQLIDAQTGGHLWAETYDREVKGSDIFTVQDDVTDHVVATVADAHGVLVRSMAGILEEKPESELTSSDWVVLHFRYMQSPTVERHASVRDGLERYVEREPRNGTVWACLAKMYVDEFCFGFNRRPEPLERALQAARRAVDIHRTFQYGHQVYAQVLFFRRDIPAFRNAAEQALALNARGTNTLAQIGLLYTHIREFDRGVSLARRAMELNPHHPGFYHVPIIWDYFQKGEYQKALEEVTRANIIGLFWQPLFVACCCGLLGRPAEAAAALEELLKLDRDFAEHARGMIDVFHYASGLQEKIFEGLEKAGLHIPAPGETPAAPGGAKKPAVQTEASATTSSASVRSQEGFRIAVLPFTHTGADPELETFADGLAEDIIAGLARFPYLSVISRNSTLRFKGQGADVRAVGEQLGARYALEGGIRKGASAIRINLQLIDTQTGAHLWAETYNRDLKQSDVFAVQDDIADRVVATVADSYGALVRAMAANIAEKPEPEMTASDWVLRHYRYRLFIAPEEHAPVRDGLERFVEREPKHAPVWAALAQMYVHEFCLGYNTRPEPLERALAAARRAVHLDLTNQHGRTMLAFVHFFRKDVPAFRTTAEQAIEMNPRDTDTLGAMGLLHMYSGNFERGANLVRRAMDLNPHHADWMHFALMWEHFQKGDYEAALAQVTRMSMPGLYWQPLSVAACCGLLGRKAEAAIAVQELLKLDKDFEQHAHERIDPWLQMSGFEEHYLEGLRLAGLRIAEPGEASAAPGGAKKPSAQTEAGATTSSASVRSQEGFWVAVLPFKSRGAEPGLEALAEGITEEIITGLSRFSYLRVIARGSTAKYAGESRDIPAIGKELGARYVMEGSIRQAGAAARLAVQLVDAENGTHLWAETFERAFRPEQIFALQDELVPRIVSTVADQHGILPRSINAAIRKKDDALLSPYEAVFRVFNLHEKMTAQEHAACRDLLERVVREVPDAAVCWAMLATLYSDEDWFGFNLRPDPLGRARAAAQRAVELAPASALASQALAQSLFMRREWQAFRPVAERTIALNPMDGAIVALMGILLACTGDWERGCAVAESAMRLNPHFPGWYRLAAIFNAYRTRDYRGAIDAALRVQMPGYFWVPATCAAAFGQLGEHQAARKALKELLAIRPALSTSAREEFGKWFDPEFNEHFLEGLCKAGLEIARS